MRKLILIILLPLTFTLLLAACGGSADDTSEDPIDLAAQGEQLYKQATIGSASSPGCVWGWANWLRVGSGFCEVRLWGYDSAKH